MLVIGLLVAQAFPQSQAKKGAQKPTAADLDKQVSKSREEVIKATQEFRASLEKLIAVYDPEIAEATRVVATRRELHAQGLASRRELDESEQKLAALQAKFDSTKNQITDCDHLVAEVEAAEKLSKLSPATAYATSGALIRYTGFAHWTLSDASKIQGFFESKFGRELPISAFGQSPVHDKMGYDHREAMDVALHPDSQEGRALMTFLQSSGIPFLGFRHAVAGSATGAHIHIGKPSPRLSRQL
jgi:hypothetical protein